MRLLENGKRGGRIPGSPLRDLRVAAATGLWARVSSDKWGQLPLTRGAWMAPLAAAPSLRGSGTHLEAGTTRPIWEQGQEHGQQMQQLMQQVWNRVPHLSSHQPKCSQVWWWCTTRHIAQQGHGIHVLSSSRTPMRGEEEDSLLHYNKLLQNCWHQGFCFHDCGMILWGSLSAWRDGTGGGGCSNTQDTESSSCIILSHHF